MKHYTIYKRNGEEREVVWSENDLRPASMNALPDLKYKGEWMGESMVILNVRCAVPIDFETGDYVLYRGEKYVLQNSPTVVKKARRGTHGDGFTYDGLKFSSLSSELADIRMLDKVIDDNGVHYTSLPNFSFFCHDIDDLADRLSVNANRNYDAASGTSADYWFFVTPSWNRVQQRTPQGLQTAAYAEWSKYFGGGRPTAQDDEKTEQNVSVNNQSVWGVMKEINNTFGLHFFTKNRVVVIGAVGIPTRDIFKYGKGNGLYEIKRSVDDNQALVTKLMAYGSDKNMPTRYYANIGYRTFATITSVDYTRGGEDPVVMCTVDLSGSVDYFTDPEPTENFWRVVVECGGSPYVCNMARNDTSWQVQVYVNGGGSAAYQDLTSKFVTGAKVYFLSGVNAGMFSSGHRETLTDDTLPNNMEIGHLMLPGFPTKSLYEWVKSNGGTNCNDATGKATWRGHTAYFSKDRLSPYILSENYASLGIREGTVIFDGSDGNDEIYPTIEGSGLDTIVAAEMITDNGVYEDGEKVKNFTITLPDFGSDFDLKSLLTGGSKISMKNGYCGGREFDIKSAVKKDGHWVCTCERDYDNAVKLWFPYSHAVSLGEEAVANGPYQVCAGDKYVLTGIEMTKTYVDLNAVKLLEASLEFLDKNCQPRFVYTPEVDELFMARQHDAAVASRSGNNPFQSYYETLKEGDLMLFQDADLNIDGSVYIESLEITEYGNGQIPSYKVVLRNDKQVGTIERMQEKLSSLSSTNGGSGGMDIPAIRSLIEAYGGDMFLSKHHDDIAEGTLLLQKDLIVKGEVSTDTIHSDNFIEGLLSGAGWGIWNDPTGVSTAEVDKLLVRMKAVFQELEIKKKTFTAGDVGFSDAANKLLLVIPLDASGQPTTGAATAYRCCWLMKDGEEAVDNLWSVDDQARCQTFNIKSGVYTNVSNRYYWRKVLEVGEGFEYDGVSYNYIDLAASESGTYKGVAFTKGCQSGVDNDIPAAQDDVIQLGNQDNDKPERQNFTEIIVNGTDAPAIKQYQGVNDYTLSEKLVRGDYYDPIKKTYRSVVYGDFYAGDKTREGGYAEYDKATNTFSVKGKLEVGSTLDDGREVNDLGLQQGNLLRNSGFTGDYESEEVSDNDMVNSDTVVYSDPFDYWDASGCTAIDEPLSASGKAAIIGTLEQTIVGGLTVGEWYMVSFRGRNGIVTVTVGGETVRFDLTGELARYDHPFICTADTIFHMEGNGSEVTELQLMVGTMPSEWHASSTDNDGALAEYYANDYLRKAITEASTTINGGLILSQILKVGNYRYNPVTRKYAMSEETGGMSGAYNDEKSPFLWGGGSMEQAIYTIMKYAANPAYQPTDQEVSRMAKFVVTHGGRAILNDIILRGYIYAIGGVFSGTIQAAGGVFSGFVEKKKLIITEKNVGQYTSSGSFGQRCLNVKKSGTWIEFRDLSDGIDIQLPFLYYNVLTYTEQDREEARSIIGNTVILHNMSNQNVLLSGNYKQVSGTSAVSFSIGPKQIATLTCKMEKHQGQGQCDEDIYWEYILANSHENVPSNNISE